MPPKKNDSDVNELQGSIDELKGAFAKIQSMLCGKIEALETTFRTDISDRMDSLEKTIRDDVSSIRDTVADRMEKLEERLTRDYTTLETKIRMDVGKVEKDITTLNTTVNESVGDLQEKIKTLEMKNIKLERSLYGGPQHDRKMNVEIDGIPVNIGDDPKQLKEAALKIFTAMNVKCGSEDIQAIHRLPSRAANKPTIIRFMSRSTVGEVFDNKGKLRNLKALNIDLNGLTDESSLFIRPSLCPYFRTLAYNCRLLKRNGLIASTTTSDDGTIKIKTLDNEFVKINHESDLTSRFTNFEHFSFN